MATIAVGDIHGYLPPLNDLLDQLRDAAGASDTVVFLGDYIDRGPDVKGCIDAILRFQEDVESDVIGLLGNHEDWMLRTLGDHTRHVWLLAADGLDTVASYSAEAAEALSQAAAAQTKPDLYKGDCTLPYDVFTACLPAEHLRFFESLRSHHQTADCLCVHGGVDATIESLDDQSTDAFLWGAHGFPNAYAGDATVVYGHRNNAVRNAEGWPEPNVIGRTIGIDTIAHGVLTAIRLPDRRVFQSARYAVKRE